MVNALVITIMVLFLLALWRKMHQKNEQLKFKYKVYALRDKIRYKAITGEIDPNHWLFDYYDNTFSKAISRSYYITLLSVLVLNFKHQDEEELHKFSKKLIKETEKEPVFREIYYEYLNALLHYIVMQHMVSMKFIIKPVALPIIGAKKLSEILEKYMKNLLYFPETSDYCNEPHPA